MIPVGSIIGDRFRVDEILGAGGMGMVVAATHLELKHRVAIKFLLDHMAENPDIVERFMREARSVVNLRTEHVCRVIDVGRVTTGAPYIVMERLEGSDLQRVVAKKPLPLTTAVEYILQACIALAEAHRAGIIHRDLKPANLFLTQRMDGGPLVKVLDFGIAKVAETASNFTFQGAMGSPGYMSPEQLHSARDVDVRTDIWSLGVTLYQLLSARLPFQASSMPEIAIRVASDPPDPLDVEPAVRAAIWRCLEKDRSRRYANVAELAADLAPFGGPMARSYLASIASVMRGSTPVPQAVPVAAGFATAGTAMAPPIAAVATPPPMMVAPPAPPAPAPRSAWPLIAISFGVLAVVGIAIAAALGGGKPAQGTQATAAHDAQLAAVVADASSAPMAPTAPIDAPAAPMDAPAAPRVDAGHRASSDAGHHASPDAGVISHPQPPPEESGSKIGRLFGKVGNTAKSVQTSVFEKACAGAGSDTLGPVKTARCACLRQDRGGAERAYAKISRSERPDVRQYCNGRGIALPE